MTDMKEIEKAIDEFEEAIHCVRDEYDADRNIDKITTLKQVVEDKRAHLLELIKEVMK
jgi:hypothetical protein